MHILIVNDDGPPSTQSSPYVHSLVQTLHEAGHVVSVVLPSMQRSWIGKAHMIGQTVKPTYYRPGTLYKNNGTTHSRPAEVGSNVKEEWILVDGTPASCVQIGLYHYFHERGPVDLVVSGPNYGRNSTAAFSLSSGTLGGALEAAICQRRAIALSFAFFSRDHETQIITEASKLSLRLIEYLYKNWDDNVDLYSINVPLVENIGQRKILWTNILQNYWGHGSCFEEKEVEEEIEKDDANMQEQKIRQTEIIGGQAEIATDGCRVARYKHKHFKWAPSIQDIHRSVEKAPPGNDGWAVQNGYTSVTPLKANFMHASIKTEGEIVLELKPPTFIPSENKAESSLICQSGDTRFFAVINYEDNYVQPLVLAALRKCLPKDSYTLINDITELPNLTDNFVQIGEYESIPFEHILAHGTSSLANTYIIRKALTRKHYLSNTVHNWVTKKSNSILKHHVKTSCHFELDYAEFLEDAIIDAWDLLESFSRNAGKARNHREWWILKPGMSERGHGIRLFSSLEELQTVFEEWETEESSLDEIEKEENNESLTSHFSLNLEKDSINNVVTSDLRHFIVQPYIHPPYLIQNNPQKFHIRTYVLAMGSLKVYVYHDMLALFSQALYVPPWNESKDLSAHLTNTCLGRDNKEELVRLFWSLQIPEVLKKRAFAQICEITGEIFEAAARGMTVHFQTIPNVFEVFGLDFLLDETGKAWLLEINAFPDFQQTGEALREVVGEFWEAVVAHTIGMFFGYCQNIQNHISCSKMVLVNELKLHGGLNGS